MVQLERSPTGHLWMDLFEQMPVVSNNPLSLLGHMKSGANVGLLLIGDTASLVLPQQRCQIGSRSTRVSITFKTLDLELGACAVTGTFC